MTYLQKQKYAIYSLHFPFFSDGGSNFQRALQLTCLTIDLAVSKSQNLHVMSVLETGLL